MDLDNDGDLDLVTNDINAPAAVYRNHTAGRNFLKIKFAGPALNKDWWNDVTVGHSRATVDTPFVQHVINKLRKDKRDLIDLAPSEYAEVKRWGPMQLNRDNILAYVPEDEAEIEWASRFLKPKGIEVRPRQSFRGDDEYLHDWTARLQTEALRRGR